MENKERLEHIILKMKAIMSYLDSVKYAAPGAEQPMIDWLNNHPIDYQSHIEGAENSMKEALACTIMALESIE